MSRTEYAKALPMSVEGLKSRCEFHMSYEHKKKRCGKAVYVILDADGTVTPVVRQYDTNPDNGYDGYFVDGCDTRFGKWSDAAAQWNKMLSERTAAHAEKETR